MNVKNLQLIPSQRSIENLFLNAAEDPELPRRCEFFIDCNIADGQITPQTEIVVEPKTKMHYSFKRASASWDTFYPRVESRSIQKNKTG